jgi:hypothetical protein
MKYMTPDLLARIRSNEDSVAEAAADEWDRQGEKYREYLEELRSTTELPRGVRRLVKRDRLHDAKVLAFAVDRGNCLSIILELAHGVDKEKRHLELRYRLAGSPGQGREFIEHPSLRGDGKPFGWWLYDEVGVTEGPIKAFTHSVLLTGGWEVRLTFSSLVWRTLDLLLLPTSIEDVVDPREVERLARERRADRYSRVPGK